MHLLRIGVLLLALGVAAPAAAIEPFVIKDIRVEGVQRTDPGTIFSYLPVKVGDTMTDAKASQAIRALFATGFYKDVTIEKQGDVLIVRVQERPTIADIQFVGLHEFGKDTVLKALKEIGLTQGRIFERGSLDRAVQELKQQYLSRGRYGTTITTTVTPLERNRVSLNFKVVEGPVAKIREIHIIGAKAFSEKTLLNQFFLSPPGLMTWYSKADQYSRQKLSADLETLRSYYLDRGYLEFNIDSTQVSITPDKKSIYITIGITEGPQYKVSGIKIAGKPLLPLPEVRKLIKLEPGQIFSRARLTESTKAISERLGDEGYAFANVNAAPDLNKAAHTASFTFYIDPGRRVYVRRINITGNNRTRDEVIRREMRQFESSWFSADKVKLSRQRIDKLGYFTEVNVETPAVAGTPDEVDVDVHVKERPTGNVLLGAGFGSGQGLILSAGISQNNIFGSGKYVSATVNSSRINTVYALSYTNPYYTVDGVSRGFSVYDRHVDGTYAGLGDYQTKTLGGSVNFGVPLSEYDTVSYGLGYESTTIDTYSDSPFFYQNYVNTFGSSNTAVTANLGWQSDKRNSRIYPTSGTLQRASFEVGLPVASLRYYKTSYRYQRYFPLTPDYTLMLNGEIGYGNGYGNKPLPFFKNFFVGGVDSLRGFRSFTVSPKDAQGNPLGGNHMLLGNAEFLFPFPGLQHDRSVRLSAFMDTGMAAQNYDPSQMRLSVGMSVLWVSPMGPLKISFAHPLRSLPGDVTQPVQFTFGGAF